MDSVTFYMKHLIPGGEGAFYVVRFVKNTQEGADSLRDNLLAAGDWSDATMQEYDNAKSGYSAVGSILNGEEWAKVEKDSDTPAESDGAPAEDEAEAESEDEE